MRFVNYVCLVRSAALLLICSAVWRPVGAQTAVPAPSSAGAVESVIISYEATREVARELAQELCGKPGDANDVKPAVRSKFFLLGTASNLSAIQSYVTFETALDQLEKEYELLGNSAPGNKPVFGAHVAVTPGASGAITAIADAVNSMKTQTTQTASTFTPVDQVLISGLERELHQYNCELVTAAYPGEMKASAKVLGERLEQVLKTRKDAQANRKSNTEDEYKNDTELQGLDSQLATLEQTLGNETANASGSSILTGRALTTKLTEVYHVLTLVNAAAGGGTRSNVYFLLNVLFPAPHPSYNGGAAVAYSLRTMNGDYELANTLYFVFGYTKWKQPPLRNSGNDGFTNFPWDNSRNKGPWKPTY